MADRGNESREFRVMRTGKNLKIDLFKILENHIEIGWAWQEWIEDFEEETPYLETTETTDKVSAMVDRKSRN